MYMLYNYTGVAEQESPPSHAKSTTVPMHSVGDTVAWADVSKPDLFLKYQYLRGYFHRCEPFFNVNYRG